LVTVQYIPHSFTAASTHSLVLYAGCNGHTFLVVHEYKYSETQMPFIVT